jgi:hypothetical protein
MALTMHVSQTLVFVTPVSDMFYTAGYNARRQRVLKGKTPDQVVAERLTAKPALAKDKPSGRAGPCDITKARLIADRTKEVSQPDTHSVRRRCLAHWVPAAATHPEAPRGECTARAPGCPHRVR